jgi:hypothetical protein
VSEGKCLINESRAFEKLSSPSIALLAQVFILAEKYPGNNSGKTNRSKISEPKQMPVIFRMRFMPYFILKGNMKLLLEIDSKVGVNIPKFRREYLKLDQVMV